MNARGWTLLVVLLLIIGGAWFLFGRESDVPLAPLPLPAGDIAPLTAPEGFAATIYARDVAGARVLLRDPKGTLLVSQTSEGKVTALPDLDGDGRADKAKVVLEGLRQPHGLAIRCPDTGSVSADQDSCILYVAETHELDAYAYDANTMTATFAKSLATFPAGDGHYTRSLLLHPDGERLLISIGSSCNVCDEKDPLRATVQTFGFADERMTPFATGLRNTVFMATDPVTGEVWGTDHGRDHLGDDLPPDEVNVLEAGGNYGWPICYGDNVHDTDFDTKQYIRDPCADMVPAHIELAAHSAPLGLAFIPEEGWPDGWGNDLFIAYHGSWNRSEPTGYKVVRFELDTRRYARSGPIDFLTGFLAPGADAGSALGRPAGLLAEPGGVLYVSDDRAGAIYRVVRTAP